MKKAFVTFCIIMMTAVTAIAGGGKQPTRYYAPDLTEGWFIDLAGTYSIFATGGSAYHHMSTWYGNWPAGVNPSGKPFIGGSVKVGRRVNDHLALRAGYDLHRSANRFGTAHFKNLHFDVMASVFDLLFKYNPDRFFNIWVHGGPCLLAWDQTGYLPGWKSNLEFGFQGGFVNSFRLTNSLDFHIDINSTATRWSFDDNQQIGGLWHRMHFDFTAEAGIMWYIGGRRMEAVDLTKADCSEQENRINELIGQVNSLQNQLANCGEGGMTVHDTIYQTITVDGEVITYPFSVFFNKGSYDLRDGRDRINLQEVAQAAIDHNLNITLRGTCDSGTASAAFNKTLAEKRCEKVKNELVKIGVPADKITIQAVGGVNELKPAEYDRRVLIQFSK